MKSKLLLIAAFAALLGLAACGGGGSANSNVVVANPASLITTDTLVGTGADAVNGKTVTVTYTGWLYSDTAPDHKGTQFDTNVGGTPLQFLLGAGNVIAGFDQGVLGMKVGGKRTIQIPSSLAYGATGNRNIPPNAGLVFDVELTNVQ